MLDALSKTFFHTLAGNAPLKRFASTYGLRSPNSFARRFIAGETLDEAIAVARQLEQRGLTLTLDMLGESVTSIAEAASAARAYLDILDRIVAAGITRNVSLKLTQLGLDLDRGAALNNLRLIVAHAQRAGFFVRIDMESSIHVDVTLDIWETVWREGYRNVGVVLQSALYRSEGDLRRVIAAGGRVRLVKGAYNEPSDVAHQAKADVDAEFVRMARALLQDGDFPAFATHDSEMLAAVKATAAELAIPRDRFEFQMLYGIRRDLQTALRADGYGVRIYLPYGREWFPYFMRRLGERPANVLFVVENMLKDR